ncbi:hypothetical protein [Chamaesiphon sp. VAR_69_metabat_338]|uniref:hypothetical protein n=1 Tax=Chamaesiphon sp. VAR_69_metabat_338 TaxID=2964704 RepID=UPI00286DDEDE|nr:hypothetical protein [Chamaesiphon sp. VAR_69_metabat_338]
MNKIILLALACAGFVVTTPFTTHALDSEKIGQNLGTRIAQYVGVASPLENRDQNRDDQYRDDQYRRNQYRDRQFAVYYRNRGDRQWILEGNHDNRRDAQRSANRLERRGYLTYVQVSRRVNSGMNRG